MSINNSTNGSSSQSQAAPAAALIDPPPLLSPEQIIEQLRLLRQQIPDFVQLPNNRETQNLRRLARSISPEFAHVATNAVGDSDVVQSAVGNTPEGMHQDSDISGRWMAAENEMRSLLRGMVNKNIVLRQRLCRDALLAYNVSRELVKQKEHAHLLPHVEAMRRLKRSRRRTKPVPEPSPNPQPVPRASDQE